MSINSGYFVPSGHRRKPTTTSYHIPLNNQQHYHQHTLLLQSARSSIETTNGNDTFLPSLSSTIDQHDGYKPHRRNDFANNHLFLAKRKLAGIFLGQPTRNLQATSDLIHLFDQQQPKRKKQNLNKNKRHESLDNKPSSYEQDIHLSVVNLVIKPPSSSSTITTTTTTQIRDPLAAVLRYRRSQAIHFSSKTSRPPIDTLNSANKQNGQSTTYTDENELDQLIDNDNISDTISTTINPFDSSLLSVKSIIPSIAPQHINHHLLQHH